MTAHPEIVARDGVSGGGADAALASALADEMVALTGLLAELAYDLAADGETLRRHMASLQLVDRITQTQLAIAHILRSDEPAPVRIASVTLESLAERLQAAYRAKIAERYAQGPDQRDHR